MSFLNYGQLFLLNLAISASLLFLIAAFVSTCLRSLPKRFGVLATGLVTVLCLPPLIALGFVFPSELNTNFTSWATTTRLSEQPRPSAKDEVHSSLDWDPIDLPLSASKEDAESETTTDSKSSSQSATQASPKRPVEENQIGNNAALDNQLQKPSRRAVSFSPIVAYSVLSFLWLIGILIALIRIALGLLVRRRFVRNCVPVESETVKSIFNSALQGQDIGFSVSLLESTVLPTPIVMGWIKPVVVLPKGIELRYSRAELESVFAHELAHIKRRDTWLAAVQAISLAIYWWNPIVHWITRRMNLLREMICDDVAVRCLNGNESSSAPRQYATVLFAMAEQMVESRADIGVQGIRFSSRSDLEHRVTRLLNHKTTPNDLKISRRFLMGLTIVFVLLAGIVPLFQINFGNESIAMESKQRRNVKVSGSQEPTSNRLKVDEANHVEYGWAELLADSNRKDFHGDNLPFNAWSRIGSMRMAHLGFNIDRFFIDVPAAERLVTVSFDTIRLWDTTTGKLVYVEQSPDRSFQGLSKIAPANGELATQFAAWKSSYDRESKKRYTHFEVRNLSDGQMVRERVWEQELSLPYDLWVTSNATRALVVQQPSRVRLLDVEQDKPLLEDKLDLRFPISIFDEENSTVYLSERHPDEVADSYGLYAIDIASMAPKLKKVAEYTHQVCPFVVGGEVAVAWVDDDGKIHCQSVERPEVDRVIRSDSKFERIIEVLDSDLENRLVLRCSVAAISGSPILVVNTDTRESRQVDGIAKRTSVRGASILANRFLTTFNSRQFELWSLDTAQRLAPNFSPIHGSVRRFAFSKDEQSIFTVSENEVQQWDVETGQLIETLLTGENFRDLAISPDGEFLAITQNQPKMFVWDIKQRKISREIQWEIKSKVTAVPVAFSSDSKRIGTFCYDCVLRWWEVETGELLLEKEIKPTVSATSIVPTLSDMDLSSFAASMSFSNDGMRMGSYAGGLMQYFDAQTGEVIATRSSSWGGCSFMPGEASTVVQSHLEREGESFNWSIEGVNIASGNIHFNVEADGDLKGANPIVDWSGRVLCFRESLDRDHRLNFWDLKEQRLLLQIRFPSSFNVGKWTFSPTGKWIAITTEFNDVLVWRTEDLLGDALENGSR